MKLRLKFLTVGLVLAAQIFSGATFAGTACEDKPPTPDSLRKGLNLALKTRNALDASQAQVALIARVGQNLSQYGLRYSHVGIAWRDHPEGPWLVVHLLNECGTATSNLYDQGLGNFFNDDLFAWEAKIIIPSPAAQAKLARALADVRIERLHEAAYNMLAYPYSTKYQNSNQWVLEMLNEGYLEQPVTNRELAQAWIKLNRYEPSRLTLLPLTRLGARMFRANIAFDDHPDELRFSNRIDTVTVESIDKFISTIDPLSHSTVVRL
ncbi:MAG TPA: DUF2145 domain-containing protein [Rhodocyclaceae bacterium]|jgi:hypothetical protein|nr:DUF2145 domain-containing protein [Rhodocyclaceae bacterium]